MLSTLIFFHSAIRWFVLGSLLYSIFLAYQGMMLKRPFTERANSVRHWTATISHIQLLLGMYVYFQSPAVMFRFPENADKLVNEQTFFRYIHIALMIAAIVMITIGSAKAKRQTEDQAKYRTMFRWFAAAVIIIFIAIPWPFSPLAARPFIRPF